MNIFKFFLGVYDEDYGLFNEVVGYGTTNHNYDNAEVLSLWNGHNIQREIRGRRQLIKNPRLNLVYCMHSFKVIQALFGEI